MFKIACTFLGCLLISMSCFAGPTTLDCQSSSELDANLNELATVVEKAEECPEPTKEQFNSVCSSILQRSEAANPGQGLSFAYQEDLWKISCANPGKDQLETAKIKIQTMWNKHRSNFRCFNYPNSIATDKNITKFSLDTGFTGFLTEAVKKYKLDMNFKDPADNKTVLDFVKERENSIRNSPPVDASKADEYNRISKLLELNGAKQAKDL